MTMRVEDFEPQREFHKNLELEASKGYQTMGIKKDAYKEELDKH